MSPPKAFPEGVHFPLLEEEALLSPTICLPVQLQRRTVPHPKKRLQGIVPEQRCRRLGILSAESFECEIQVRSRSSTGCGQQFGIDLLSRGVGRDDPVAKAGEFQTDAVLEKGIADTRKRLGKQEVLSNVHERRDRDKRAFLGGAEPTRKKDWRLLGAKDSRIRGAYTATASS
jgi:hypothetical protein